MHQTEEELAMSAGSPIRKHEMLDQFSTMVERTRGAPVLDKSKRAPQKVPGVRTADWRTAVLRGTLLLQKRVGRPMLRKCKQAMLLLHVCVRERVLLQGYLGYEKPELEKTYRIWPPRFLNLGKRGSTGFFHDFPNLRRRRPTDSRGFY